MLVLDFAPVNLNLFDETFNDRIQLGVPMERFTASRLGGPAEALLEVHTTHELVEVVTYCWRNEYEFRILGGGSNVLVSDAGVRGLVVINRVRNVVFHEDENPPVVWAESGANFGLIARLAAQRGLSGLEWAAGIPGTLGGAVVGNAGAHSSDIAGNLLVADILHRQTQGSSLSPQPEEWPKDRLAFTYRSSVLKAMPGKAIVLSATLQLGRETPDAVQQRMDDFVAYRRRTQPPGASMGSMFKNPPGDYAGRLIEAAGLKGFRIGDAQISPMHANFFINLGNATSADFFELIQLARHQVEDKFSIQLELEVELIGEW